MKTMTSHLLLLAGASVFAGAYTAAWHALKRGEPATAPFVGTPEERRRSEELDTRRTVMLRRLDVKVDAIQALLRGAIDLREAAQRFREVTAEDPTAEQYLRKGYPGVSDTEVYCRNVLAFAAGELSDRPADEAEAIQACLEAELAEILQAEMDKPCGADELE